MRRERERANEPFTQRTFIFQMSRQLAGRDATRRYATLRYATRSRPVCTFYADIHTAHLNEREKKVGRSSNLTLLLPLKMLRIAR